MASPLPENLLAALAGRASAFLNLSQRLAYAQVDEHLHLQAGSDHLALWLGNPSGSTLDCPLIELVPEFFGAEEELRRVQHGELPEYTIEQVQRQGSDSTLRYLTIHLVAPEESLPLAGLVLIVEDVTHTSQLEQRLAQDRNELRLAQARLSRANAELQRLSQEKSLFLSIAAHDLRAPLTAIAGYTGLARSKLPSKSPGELDQYLAIVEEQAGWLDRLIDDLLDLDQIEQGKISIHLQACALAPILSEVAERMRVLAGQRDLALELHMDRTLQPVMADPQRVRQVLYNLLSNAIKYTSEGGQIQVEAWDEQAFGVFQVRDNGLGIPVEAGAHLFELYYRFGEAGRRSSRGTGLGLYIVKHLVQAQGGKIEVDTRLGQGTAFKVYLPHTLDRGEG